MEWKCEVLFACMLPTIERRNMKLGLMGGNPGFAHFSCGHSTFKRDDNVCAKRKKNWQVLSCFSFALSKLFKLDIELKTARKIFLCWLVLIYLKVKLDI